MPLVSVIIPIYNVEKYIDRCLHSIIHQTFHDFEIVLIDDGSTDQSAHIIDRYDKEYSFIHAFHFENAGVSAARNRGIQLSKGEYIMFVDSDDFIDSKMLEAMVDMAIGQHCDIVNCGYRIDFGFLRIYRKICNSGIMSPIEAVTSLVESEGMTNYPWGKLYKKSLFESIHFPEDKNCFEDAYTIFKILLAANQIGNIKKRYYHYMHRNGSLTDRMDLETTYEMRKSFEYQESYLRQNYPNEIFHFDMQYLMADVLILTTIFFYYSKKDKVDYVPASINWTYVPTLFHIGYTVLRFFVEVKNGTRFKKRQEDFEI